MKNKQYNWTEGTTYWKWFRTNGDIMVPLCASIVFDILTLLVFKEDFKEISTFGKVLTLILINAGGISMPIYSIFWWKKEKNKLND